MGKIKFTLTYIIFWLIVVFSCLLIENFALFSYNPLEGFSLDSAIILSLFTILLLAIYYFYEHKYNKMTFDKILLPTIVVLCLLFILTIWWQGAPTFVNPDSGATVTVSFNAKEKWSYSLQVVISGAVLYGILFAVNRYHIVHKWLRWLIFVYVLAVLVCTIIDVVMEFDVIKAVFDGTSTGEGLNFVFYNENLWANFVMVSVLSALILNLKKFNLFYYLSMVHFCIYGIFTTCATTIIISFVVLISYTFYEIIAYFRRNFKKALLLLITYLAFLCLLVVGAIVFVRLGSNIFANFWKFIYTNVFRKDYLTFSSRTNIWKATFMLLMDRPINLIFGLGFKTSNVIFSSHYRLMFDQGFAPRSCHNGFIEILLRHGIIGLLFYLMALGLFVTGIVKLIRFKKYRTAFFYGLCFLALIAHSMMESTTFLTTNVSGLYMTVIFFMPVISLIQNKKINETKNYLANMDVSRPLFDRKKLSNFLAPISLGISISLLLSFTLPITSNHFVGYIYLSLAILSLLVFLVAPLFDRSVKNVTDYFKTIVRQNIINNFLTITLTVFAGIISSFILRQFFLVDVFSSMIYVFFVLAIYLWSFSILNKNEQLIAFSYINGSLLGKMKKYIIEEQHG